MNAKDPVLFLSAGLLRPKKQDHLIARQHRYLNYGLLGLATIVSEAGYSPRVVHGHFDDPNLVLDRLEISGWLAGAFPVFLSLPSSLAVEWAQRFANSLRQRHPKKQIIAGGRWVVGDDGTWIRGRIPEVNLVVFGTAEGRVLQLLSPFNWAQIPGTDLCSRSAVPTPDGLGPHLNYQLLDQLFDFQPSIEVSRGCGMGCSFCVEKAVSISPLRLPNEIVDQFENLEREVFRRSVHPYFECSFFKPSLAWAQSLLAEQKSRGTKMNWRTESRVDIFTDELLTTLANGGLKVIDVGLESASPQQLLRMGKTKHPDVYLKKASHLIGKCSELGIWVKVNILFYAGETEQTIAESCAWLNEHRGLFKGVSVNSVIVYRGDTSRLYLEELGRHGARLVDPESFETLGYGHIHLSETINSDQAKQLCASVARRFMSAKDYFDLKAFSYFPTDFTFPKFLAAAQQCNPDDLPFDIGNLSSICASVGEQAW